MKRILVLLVLIPLLCSAQTVVTGATTIYLQKGSFTASSLGQVALNTIYDKWTIPENITVTRFEMQQNSNTTVMSGCTTLPQITLTDGTTVAYTVTGVIDPATQYYDSGALSVNYAAGAVLTIKVSRAGVNCANGQSWNFTTTYRMR